MSLLTNEIMNMLKSLKPQIAPVYAGNAYYASSCGCTGNCGQTCSGECLAGCAGSCGRSCSGSGS